MPIFRKLLGAAKTLRKDPETFARNLLQYTDPAAFEARLIDVMHATPMHFRFDPDLDAPVRLNVLDSAWTRTGMTGGPNTVVNLAFRVAQQGVTVRLVATVQRPGIDAAWLRSHAESLLGKGGLPEVPVAWAGDASEPLVLGPRDVFFGHALDDGVAVEGGFAGAAAAKVLLYAAGVRSWVLSVVEQLCAGVRDAWDGFLADRQ